MHISDMLRQYNRNVSNGTEELRSAQGTQKLVSTIGELSAGSVFEGTVNSVKGGKVNTDIKFIYKDSSVGTKDGIYLVNDEVWLVANGTPINLRGEIGNTYVSFLKQETTSEQKQIALKNIGFIYNSLDEYQIDSGIQNGVIYVQDEQKLYIISQGNVTPLSLSIPNPFTEQFILDKRDDKNGALVIN